MLQKCKLFFLLLLFACFAAAQSPHFFTYNSTEGLPQSQVWAAYPDSRGFLWFGTQGGGLSRFGGREFSNYTVSDGLPSDFVHCIDQDVDYRLWIGTEKGLCFYDGQTFQKVAGLERPIQCLRAWPRDSLVFAGTSVGLYSLRVGHDFSVKKATWELVVKNTSIFSIVKTTEGLWVGASDGLRLIQGKNSHFFGRKEGLPGQGIYAIAPTKNKTLLLGAWGVGLVEYSPEKQAITQRIGSSILSRPLDIFQHPNGQFWVATQNQGLVILDENLSGLQQVTEVDGLPHNHVRAITQDVHGQVWVATSGGGVARSLRQNFTHYDLNDGLAGSRIYAVAEDFSGQLWLSASLEGVQLRDSTGFSKIPLPEIFHQVKCKSICADKQGRMWIGTEGKGIVVAVDNFAQPKPTESLLDSAQIAENAAKPRWSFFQINTENGLPENWVQQLLCAADGQMWAAFFNRGLARLSLQDSSFSVELLGERQGLKQLNISALALDKKNTLWYGTQAGTLGFVEKNKVQNIYATEDGLPKSPIRSLAFDRQNRLWVGTKGAGIFRGTDTGNTSFVALKTKEKLSSNNIYLLLADENGFFWAGHERGVDKIVLDKKGEVEAIFPYGRKEGFLGMETCHNAALHDRSGQLWFGTMNGLMRLLPTDEKRQTQAPTVHFDEISLFYKPFYETSYAAFLQKDGNLAEGLQLPYNQNHLSFNFKAVDLEKPERLRYHWKLEGAETDWSPPSNRQSVNYVNLQPGIYTFLVEATTDEVLWSAPQKASFEILKPFWQTTTFRLLAALLLATMLGLIAWSWVRSVRKREEARRHELEVQNHVLQLEQKALQLQMNPHFIFNALTGIRALITEKDFIKARSEINEFAKLMRSVLNNSRRQSISLKEEIDTLRHYLAIEQFCHNDSFDFSIHVAGNIDPEEVELPPMLLQPFVENAVVHGVSHLAYKGSIEVKFDVENNLLRCSVRDNGIGREKAAKLQEEKKPGHQSVALQVTQERLEAMRGEKVYNCLEIKDLRSENQEIGGTEVVLRLPFLESW